MHSSVVGTGNHRSKPKKLINKPSKKEIILQVIELYDGTRILSNERVQAAIMQSLSLLPSSKTVASVAHVDGKAIYLSMYVKTSEGKWTLSVPTYKQYKGNLEPKQIAAVIWVPK